MVDIDGAVNAVGLGEKTATAVKILSDISFGTDDTQELYEKAIDWGVAKITSPDKSITPDVVVAENKSGGSSFPDLIFGVGNYVNNAGEMLMALPGGTWSVTAVDKTGNSDTAPLVSITPQSETAVSYVANDPVPDSLDTIFDEMNDVHISLIFGPSNQMIFSLLPSSNVFFPASFLGKIFSADYFYFDEVYEWEHDLTLNGNITQVSYDLIGVTLTARKITKKYYSDDPDIVYREIIEEVSAEDIPLTQISSSGTYINYQFDISSYYTPDLISQLPSLVTFSYRSTYFDKEGNITSEKITTDFIESSDNRIRIMIGKKPL